MRRRLFRTEESAVDGLAVGALAPMVDMMTLLLVFLLRTWSTDVAPSPPSGAFTLAGTSSTDPRAQGITVMVSREAVWVEGHRVLTIASMSADLVIREIYDPLLILKDHRRVEVHVDGAVPYAVVKRVIATCRAAGVDEIALVGVSAEGM